MDLLPTSTLRAAIAADLVSVRDVDVYQDDVASIANADGTNTAEFFTVFFIDADETEDGEFLDSETYETIAGLTVGYHKTGADQAALDVVASALRAVVMGQSFSGDIKRDGWQYLSAADGATPGIHCRFIVRFSN